MTVRIDDTIAAIATSIGEAGISIIRISGDDAIGIVSKIFLAKSMKTVTDIRDRTLTYGWIEKNGKVIDEVMVCLMRNPNSFTAEDVVEIHSHGGIYITRTILNLVLDLGARLANPGEFTQRAFLNGRIDLTQAEAINDIIRAKSELELDVVINQLKGSLFEKISFIRDQISWILALTNAGIDFPEEDVIFANREEIEDKVTQVVEDLQHLIGTAETGMKIKEGYHVVLTGKPNVGKSSILNGLLGNQRAIVHQVPGTTRDTIEESFSIKGIPVSLIDTAGIHQTDDLVEKEGIERALSAVRKADLVLWVIDLSDPSFDTHWMEAFQLNKVPMIMILNKRDLISDINISIPDEFETTKRMIISAHQPGDLESLREAIYTFISGQSGNLAELTMLTNMRQKQAAEKSLASVQKARDSLTQGRGEEFLAVDLSQALSDLGEIVGQTTPDDMLNQIFSQFCIGK